MARFLSRGVWLVAVLALAAPVGWHALGTQPEAQLPAASPSPLPSAAAEPFAPLGADAPLPHGAALTAAVEAAVKGKHGGYAVAVQDVATGETLVDRQAATPGVPASSLKLLTGAAALASFEHGHRFTTSVTVDSGHRLRLVGGGDALLGAGASQPGSVAGHAGLETLAKLTVEALGKLDKLERSYTVLADTSLFPGPALNPDWTEDLITTNNITEVQTPVINAGRASASHTSAVVRQPANAALAAFVKALTEQAKAAKLETEFTAGGQTGKDEHASELASVESATLLEQLGYMEAHSDNFMAETFGRLVAVQRGATGSLPHAREQVTAAVKALGVDTTGLSMADTSGLAATNKVTPVTLASLLTHAAASNNADLRELATLLPVSGATGTLAGRLKGEATTGLVRAKTGTLAAVVSLSGYATTADGRLLSFSVMASGVQGALTEARGVADTIAAALLK
ncbi:D-alanyl-D-alanine carboxypeptidase/D-alanyl-D-alanine endopeptidase [Galactobacter valiniphilus]|uniref:D-alanyl-D-alanine carboxypeptidase/D-alanyl-D-alanine endopeptidase n=1 Tax=Galactobacter valiniphilus TaxID=2676122 RepID=UPI001313E4F1|nr:D-alanyl-D-alanine carboxypeptidase/D-alanyl-D-alanine-endopeptidase [Galactobacter valiniphilus]